jgi:hypothetical protein
MKIRDIKFNNINFFDSIRKENYNNGSKNVLSKEAIRIKISELGNKHYDYQKSNDTPKIFDNMLKVLKEAVDNPIKAYHDYIDETIYGKALALKEGTETIMNMSMSMEEKKEKLSILNNQYEKAIKSASKNISLKLDNYFDSGTSLLEIYSNDPIKDIFDRESFENHIRFLSLSVKKIVFNEKSSMDLESLKYKIEAKSSDKNVLEKMSIKDMKEVLRFTYQVDEKQSAETSADSSIGEKIADRESTRLEFISKLDISQSTQKGMIASEKRQSQGMLLHHSYQEEMKKSMLILDEYSEYLKSLNQRLKRIQERILEVKELFGVTVKNDLLLNLLDIEENFKNKVSKVKEKKDKISEDRDDLEKDKSLIRKKETYKENSKIYNDKITL